MTPRNVWAGCFRLILLLTLASPVPAVADQGTTLTLVTYNIHVGVPMGEEIGKYRVGYDDVRRQADVLTSAAADIAGLQEVDCEFGLTLPPSRHRSSLLPLPRLLAHFTGTSYVFGSAQDDVRYPSDNAGYVEWGMADEWTNNGKEHGEVGNALLCRLPLVGTPENLALPRLPDKERRACIRAELAHGAAPGGKLIVYNAHLQHDSSESRVEQMQAILERATKEQPGFLVFILGDLNDEPAPALEPGREKPEAPAANPHSLALEAGFHDLYARYADTRSGGATYPADSPRSRIDYILCNQPLRVLSADVLETTASDHLPVRVVVEMPPSASR